MALIKCDECGNRISDKSLFCPSCGYPTHLNKVFREASKSKDTVAAQSANEDNSSSKSVRFTEMDDDKVKEIINGNSATETSATPSNATQEKAEIAETPNAKTAPSDEIATEAKETSLPKEKTPEKKDENANTSSESTTAEKSDLSPTVEEEMAMVTEAENPDKGIASDPLADFEASLTGKPMNVKRNNTMKLVLYFSVLIILLGAVFGCYYYAKITRAASMEDMDSIPQEEVKVEQPVPADTTTTQAVDSTATANNPTVQGANEVATNNGQSQTQSSGYTAPQRSTTGTTTGATKPAVAKPASATQTTATPASKPTQSSVSQPSKPSSAAPSSAKPVSAPTE